MPHRIIICYDLLPPLRRGSHAKSDYTHTIIQHSPLSPFTSGVIFTVYIFLQSSIAQHPFHCSAQFIPLIHSVSYIPFTSSICSHLQNNPLQKTVHHLVSHPFDHIYISETPHNFTFICIHLQRSFLHTLPNSLTGQHNFSSESATIAASFANMLMLFISNLPFQPQQFQPFPKHHRIHI